MTRSSHCIARSLPVLCALGLVFPSTLLAGPNSNAKVLLHLSIVDKVQACTQHPDIIAACTNIRTSGGLYPPSAIVYALVTDADATAGVQNVHFGISYDNDALQGVDVFSWSSCLGAQVSVPGVNGAWPSSLSGTTTLFTTCQTYEPGGAGTGVVAPAGYFYLGAYGADNLAVTTHPTDGLVWVTSCASDVDVIDGDGAIRVPSPLGYVRFSEGATEPGYSPCGDLVIPIEQTTWGRVKTLIAR